MRDSSQSFYPERAKASALARSRGQTAGRGPLHLLRRLVGAGGRGPLRERTSAEVTTQLQLSRGQALREAHHTLRQHMQRHPALKHVTPHLWALERALRKQGSRALTSLPLAVLQRSLAQLALLQREDESPEDAAQLRVLRLRMIEAIGQRGPVGKRHGLVTRLPQLPSEPPRLKGLDVRHVSVDEYNRAVKHGTSPQLTRLNPHTEH